MKGPTNWVKKVQAAPTTAYPPPLYAERGKDPFSGAQIANGAEMKCLREARVQASVSAGPVDGFFINCSTVHTVYTECTVYTEWGTGHARRRFLTQTSQFT